MSYIRGKYYAFQDSDGNINIWSDSPSNHLNSSWAEEREDPNGVSIPKYIFDEIILKYQSQVSMKGRDE